MLRVNHFSTSDIRGGASLAAFRMHKCVERSGFYESKMIVQRKYSYDESVYLGADFGDLLHKGMSKLSRVWLRSQYGRDYTYRSGCNIGRAWKNVSTMWPADVYHIHWIQGGFINACSLKNTEVPVVWTLHDMWPIYGLEHYPSVDHQERKGSTAGESVHRLIGSPHNLLSFHCTTEWMAKQVLESPWGNHYKIYQIPYPLSNEFFDVENRAEVRDYLGIGSEEFVIVYGAINATGDKRKGYDLLKQCLIRLVSIGIRARLLIFGCEFLNEQDKQDLHAFRPLCVGFIKEAARLAEIYSACDVMIVPSRIEAFGQTATEAQASGLPTVCFSGSGVSELIEDGQTGFVVPAFDSVHMAQCVYNLYSNKELQRFMSANAKKRAQRLWSEEVIGGKMYSMYRSILG